MCSARRRRRCPAAATGVPSAARLPLNADPQAIGLSPGKQLIEFVLVVTKRCADRLTGQQGARPGVGREVATVDIRRRGRRRRRRQQVGLEHHARRRADRDRVGPAVGQGDVGARNAREEVGGGGAAARDVKAPEVERGVEVEVERLMATSTDCAGS